MRDILVEKLQAGATTYTVEEFLDSLDDATRQRFEERYRREMAAIPAIRASLGQQSTAGTPGKGELIPTVYKPHVNTMNVVSPDHRFAAKIREQGYGFVKYEPKAAFKAGA